MKKRLLCVPIVLLLVLLMTACTSKDVKEVEKQIDALSSMVNPTLSDIQYVQNEYNSLSPSDKAMVSNLETLNSIVSIYYKRQAEELDNQIDETVRSGDIEKMSDLYDTISQLDDEVFSNLKSLDDLYNALSDAVVKQVLSYGENDSEEIHSLMIKYKSILTDDQLTECLVRYGKWGALEQADNYIKSRLKSPRSYHRYGGTSSGPGDPLTDGGYVCGFNIKYGGTNSFGGEVTSTMKVHVKFFIDTENISINYAYVGEDGIKAIIADP